MYKRIAAKYINAILFIDNDGVVQPINVHYTKLLQIYNVYLYKTTAYIMGNLIECVV